MMTALLVVLATAPVGWGEGRQAFLDSSALAEIHPSPEGAAALRALDPEAVVRERSGRVSLWQLSAGSAARVLAVLETKLPGHFAAVFHDEPSAGSKLRVPAGGVLVWLEASTNAERWAVQRGLVVKQSFGSGTLLLESAPGAASLALATTLRSDPRVRIVMPNWWLRAVRR